MTRVKKVVYKNGNIEVIRDKKAEEIDREYKTKLLQGRNELPMESNDDDLVEKILEAIKKGEHKKGDGLSGLYVKNRKKLEMLTGRGINVSDYPEEMIKMLLDGDYKKQLHKHKHHVTRFITELLDKKFPITKLGVQTKLYKLVRDFKKGKGLFLDENGKAVKPKAPQGKKALYTKQTHERLPLEKPIHKPQEYNPMIAYFKKINGIM